MPMAWANMVKNISRERVVSGSMVVSLIPAMMPASTHLAMWPAYQALSGISVKLLMSASSVSWSSSENTEAAWARSISPSGSKSLLPTPETTPASLHRSIAASAQWP